MNADTRESEDKPKWDARRVYTGVGRARDVRCGGTYTRHARGRTHVAETGYSLSLELTYILFIDKIAIGLVVER